MNGGLSECVECDCDPCICEARAERKRIREGKNVADELNVALKAPGRWRRKIIKWIFPEIIDVADTLKKYYQ